MKNNAFATPPSGNQTIFHERISLLENLTCIP